MVAEVTGVVWPELLDEIDDQSPATVVLSVAADASRVVVRGISHDNGEISSVEVNGEAAELLVSASGVVDWQATLEVSPGTPIMAFAKDRAGNIEQMPHQPRLD